MSVKGVDAKAQTQQAPPPPPPPPKPKGTLPKGMEQAQTQQAPPPQQQTTSNSNEGKSRKEILEEYEKDYLQRAEQERLAARKSISGNC